MILKADHGKGESPADGGAGKYTLSGNVRAGPGDGPVIKAKQAVIDLVEETITFKMDIGIDIPKK
jgi:hypothetical protein